MGSALQLIGGSVPKVLESPMKVRKVIRIIDIARKENSMTQQELINVFKYIVKKCDMLINNGDYEADAYTQDTVEDIAELCNHILDGDYGKLVEVKEMQEEPVSEDLEEACKEWLRPQLDKSYANYGEAKMMELTRFDGYAMLDAIEFGAQWQKENLWKPADGDDLPIFDREVIVLVKYSTQLNIYDKEYPTYRVEFGHRPNPDGWDGKSLTTGEVEHYTPKTYDKGGWNIPNVKYWLDCELPKME
jgi:hypothetical protein